VVVAMSGGVDSSAAAALLREQGHEVIGIALRLSRSDRPSAPGRCCSPDDLDDARAVADVLDIPFYVFEASELFDAQVIRPFVDDYLAGVTPVPCLACNRAVKFGHLLARARALGAKLATGHYARIVEEGSARRLLRGVDAARDQSYFLYELSQAELADLIFPVGDLVKAEARAAARRAGLPTADKPESQDICFVPDGDAAGFVERHAGATAGHVVDRAGTVLGEHGGIHRYTVGQRKGLPAGKLPLYVSEIRPERGEIVAGPVGELDRTAFGVERATFVSGAPPAPDEVITVRVRHRHAGAPCRIESAGGTLLVQALEPVRAPAPGQAAVFYRGDEVLGGGIIARARTDATSRS
jgi:tRNA-specific 2-thiouridylase